MASKRLVVVVSDLGTRDPAVAEFRSAVLNVNPEVEILEATHEVRPHDLLEAAFTLERICRQFPSRTVFTCLVDQYRGGPRRPLLAVSPDRYYFAPDNGVLSFIYASDPPSSVYHVEAEHYIRQPVNPMAHHRDVYGTAVGWLTKGIESSNFGPEASDYVRTQVPQPKQVAANQIQGQVLHVDRFGTLVTNIPDRMVNAVRHELGAQVPFQARIGDKAIPVIGGWSEGGPEVFAIYGASGFVEIAAPKAEASQVLGARRGEAVSIVFGG